MSDLRPSYWLETRDARVSIQGGSALVGRSRDCDVVLLDERVSRHHALFRVVEEGVELIALGQLPVVVNGVPVGAARRLTEGDVVDVAGVTFTLRRADPVESAADVHWFAERTAGVLVRVGAERLTVGGGAGDHLAIPGWGPGAVALATVGSRLVAEVLSEGVAIDGPPRGLGDLVTLRSGARVEHRGSSFRVLALPADPSRPTRKPDLDALPNAVTLTFLPRGGQLAVTVGARILKLYLSEKRCELVACLIQPPTPYAAGELIPDAVIASRLWPSGGGGRTEINTLVWRVRKDLASAGFDDVSLIDRAGGGLRLCLAEGGRSAIASA